MSTSIRIKKSLGQHFLRDAALARQIANLLTDESLGGTVIEVGPGKGNLTDVLRHKAIARLYLVEVDGDLIPYLKKKYASLSDRIIEADFLKLSLTEEFQEKRLTIIGNFPYNISSEIFFKILDNRNVVGEMVGMFQKEVAQRITAKPGNKVYGMLSVLLQAFYTIAYHFTVAPDRFFPPPKVDSAVITMHRNNLQKLPCDETLFFQIVKRGFQHRRKKLQNALAGLNLPNRCYPGLLHKRAEELSVVEFIELTNALAVKALV